MYTCQNLTMNLHKHTGLQYTQEIFKIYNK